MSQIVYKTKHAIIAVLKEYVKESKEIQFVSVPVSNSLKIMYKLSYNKSGNMLSINDNYSLEYSLNDLINIVNSITYQPITKA